ncbi:hypothetical protein B0H34DRAFT_807666 [Crassisporium funariophilum]|nr:hypothetical protein B0H34DRAFT_807666 [Crassisporium funariophilum]
MRGKMDTGSRFLAVRLWLRISNATSMACPVRQGAVLFIVKMSSFLRVTIISAALTNLSFPAAKGRRQFAQQHAGHLPNRVFVLWRGCLGVEGDEVARILKQFRQATLTSNVAFRAASGSFRCQTSFSFPFATFLPSPRFALTMLRALEVGPAMIFVFGG